MRTLLLIFALACTAFGQVTKCPGLYQVVGAGCYAFPEGAGNSWIQASSLCQISGGYLAKIDSAVEQSALHAYQTANFPTTTYLWIGASDMLSEGTWRWIPSGSNVVYENWASGQPTLSTIDNCAYWFTDGNFWDTIGCCNDSNILPLCEADPL